MDRYDITITSPPINDKKLNKVYTELAAEIGTNANKRRQAETTWQNNDRQRGDVWHSRNLSQRAEGVRLALENNRIEFALLDAEIPVAEKVINYLGQLSESNQKELRIAEAKINLAKEQVLSVFRRDYPIEVWFVNEGILDRFVNQHPIVLGAIAKLEELDLQVRHTTTTAIATARDVLARSKQRRQELADTLPQLKSEAKELQQSVDDEVARNAAANAAQLEVQHKAEAAQHEAVKEARFRISKLFKRTSDENVINEIQPT